MPRRIREHHLGAFYHVTQRGNHLEPIFVKAEDWNEFSMLVGEPAAEYGARVLGYCWMPNHVHLVIRVGEVPLGRIMQRIAVRHSRRMHRQLKTSGHLFERRYCAKRIEGDEHLKDVLRYIDLTPVAAGMVVDPGDYRWSSCANYIGRRDDGWVHTEFALRLYHSAPFQARELYRCFLERTLIPPTEDGEVPRAAFTDLVEETCRAFHVTSEACGLPRPRMRDAPERTLHFGRERIRWRASRRWHGYSDVARLRFGC